MNKIQTDLLVHDDLLPTMSPTCADELATAANAVHQLALHERKARMRCFTEVAPDATIHFQILDLGQQLYVWVAVGGAKLQNLYLAIQSRLVGASCNSLLVINAAQHEWLLHQLQHLNMDQCSVQCRTPTLL